LPREEKDKKKNLSSRSFGFQFCHQRTHKSRVGDFDLKQTKKKNFTENVQEYLISPEHLIN